MTEQQQHLTNLLQQRNLLNDQMTQTKELLLKVQGVIEYLTQIGVTLPESEPQQSLQDGQNPNSMND